MDIAICYPLKDKNISRLSSEHRVRIATSEEMTRSELLKFVSGADVVVTLLSHKIDDEFFEEAGNQLRLVANYAVGFNNIDLDGATSRGIVVLNTPGILTEAVAEHIMTLILLLSRNILMADKYVRAGKFRGWKPDLFLGHGVRGRILGIVGMGSIGKWTARLAKGLGMKIVYYSRTRDEEIEITTDAVYHKLDTLLGISDFISLSVPLSNETRRMIGRKELLAMKDDAYIINTSRGEVVDEKALIWALKNKEIAGAGLDVFEHEDKINPELWKMENVVLTPHIASATYTAREEMSRVLVKGINDVISNRKPTNLVNIPVWDKRNNGSTN
jgi:glyoxylate reductase